MSVLVKYKPQPFEDEWLEDTLETGFLVETLMEFRSRYYQDRPDMFKERVCILINDEEWDVDSWNSCMLEDGDTVTVIPAVLGGGGGGLITSIIGVALIATGVGIAMVPIGTWVGMGISAATMAAVAGGLMVAGTVMAISGVVTALTYKAPEMPSFSSSGDITMSSPTYSWDGASTQSMSGIPIPVVYGEHIVAGNIISYYTTTSGAENYLNVLLSLCEGEIDGILKEDESGVCPSNDDTPWLKLNEQPFSRFSDISWSYRLGTSGQSQISGFRYVHTYYSMNLHINTTGVEYTSVGDTIDKMTIFLRNPSLYEQNKKGELVAAAVEYVIEYREYGTSLWHTADDFSLSKSTTSPYTVSRDISFPSSGRWSVRVSRKSPESSDYKIQNKAYLVGVDEIQFKDLAYPNTALVYVKIKASDVLSGAIPNFYIKVRGKRVLVPELKRADGVATEHEIQYNDTYWDSTESTYKLISNDAVLTETGEYTYQWTQNPVYCIRDLLTNKRYGLGEYIEESLIDDDYINTAAKYAWELVSDNVPTPEHRFHLDIVIDKGEDALSVLNSISKTFRGWAVWAEGTIKFICDKPDTPVQLFTMGNIVKNSFSETFVPLSKIPNVVEGVFSDESDDYKLTSREVVYEPDWVAGKPKRVHREDFKGVTRESQVLRECSFFLSSARNRTRAISFKGGLDSIHAQAGDLIKFQHDVNDFGWGGRITQVVSATCFVVDTDNLDTVNDGVFMVNLPDGSLQSAYADVELSNKQIVDSSSKGTTGYLHGNVEATVGHDGTADTSILFDNSENETQYGIVSNVTSTPIRSYSIWYKPVETPSSYNKIVLDKHSDHRHGIYHNGDRIVCMFEGEYRTTVADRILGVIISWFLKPWSWGSYFTRHNFDYVQYTLPQYNQWYHIVTKISTASRIELYVNGVKQARGDFIFPDYDGKGNGHKSAPVRIGGGDSGKYVKLSAIEDARIFSGELTSTAIASLYNNATIVATDYGELGYWKLDEGSKVETHSPLAASNIVRLTEDVFSPIPEVGNVWAYGRKGVDVKTYRILGLTRENNCEVGVYALEYNASIYDDSHVLVSSPVNRTTLPNLASPAGPVASLTLTETSDTPGFWVGFIPPRVSASPPTFDINYSHAEVWLSASLGEGFHFVANDYGYGDTKITGLVPGNTYIVRVYSVNKQNVKNETDYATKAITLEHVKPWAPTGLELIDGRGPTVFKGKDAKFRWRASSTISGAGAYGFGWEPAGLGQWYPESSFQYVVEIWVGGNMVRTETITDTNYVYSYEKNLVDNDTPQGSFTIKVYGWNSIANQKSPTCAELDVTNDTPSAVTSLTTDFDEKDLVISWDGTTEPDFDYYNLTINGGTSKHITDNTYTYTYSENIEQNGSADGTITVEIYKVDVFGQSGNTNSTTAVNSAPSSVSGVQYEFNSPDLKVWWNQSSESDVDRYRISFNDNTHKTVSGFSYTYTFDENAADNTPPDPSVKIDLSAADVFGNVSASVTTTAVNPAPTAPTNVMAIGGLGGIRISWRNKTVASETDITHREIYRNTVDATTTATFIASVGQYITHYIDLTGTNGPDYETDYYYYLKAVDCFGQHSDFSATSGGLNKSGLVKVVATAIVAGAVKGVHIDTDAITETKIASNAITSPKIKAKAVSAGKLAALSVLASNVAALAIDSDNIAANAITSGHLRANCVQASHLAAGAIDADAIDVDKLSALTANCGTLSGGAITGVTITGGVIQTSDTSGSKIVLTSDGLTLHSRSDSGKFNTFKFSDNYKYGSGALAFIHHRAHQVPFYISTEQDVGDFHFYPRTSVPSGTGPEEGDVCCVDGKLMICTTDGDPNSWVVVGSGV